MEATSDQPPVGGEQPSSGSEGGSEGGEREESLYLSQGGQIYTTSQADLTIYSAIQFISVYGWYFLLAAVVVVVVWVKVRPYFLDWRKRREEWIEEQNFDPARAEQYQDEMLRARERMQRLHDQDAIERQRKEEERVVSERDERIEQWEKFKVVTKSRKPKPKDDHGGPSFSRREYLPLSGGGGGGGYRPTRRTFGGGG